MEANTIEEIKRSLSIEEVLSHFGVDVPARGRDPVMVRCPWHEDRVPSLAVYRREGKAWCYACQVGGDVLDVTALFLQDDIGKAIRYWADRLGLEVDRPLSPEERKRLREEERRRKERRICQEIARRGSLLAEQGLPRPRNLEELEVYDHIYTAKDRLDEGLEWVEDRNTLLLFLSGLRAWRRKFEIATMHASRKSPGGTKHQVAGAYLNLLPGEDRVSWSLWCSLEAYFGSRTEWWRGSSVP